MQKEKNIEVKSNEPKKILLNRSQRRNILKILSID